MKFNFTLKVMGNYYLSSVKDLIKDRNTLKSIKKEYRAIMERASDIGSKNILLSSYSLGAIFIAIIRNSSLKPDDIFDEMVTNLRKSKIMKLAMGSGDKYLGEKKKAWRLNWAKETQKRKYKNDWVCDIVVDDGVTYGLDYLECGICKLCRDEDCFELAKYPCKLDFMLADLMGLKLTRTTTLADGGDKCDFRYTKK